MIKLYEIEFDLFKLREENISIVKSNNLTLKEVLDLGFYNIYIDNHKMYKDEEGDYIIDNFYIINDEKLLNTKVIYNGYEMAENIDDEIGNYLEIYVKFANNKYSKMLKNIIKTIEEMN